jgi:hypothetical protein
MRFATLLLALVALVCGCADMAANEPSMAPMSPAGYPARAEMMADEDSGGGEAEGPMMTAQNTPAPAPAPLAPGEDPPAPNRHDGTSAPLLIYTAEYTVAVFEVKEALDKVQNLAKDAGGYLVSRNDQGITVRVPAEKYRPTLTEVGKIGDILHHSENVDDVTEEFFDTLTRLNNAKTVRARLQELMAAAKDVTEALAVERELARVTEEIEVMEGKLKRLKELVNFSTITVNFSSRASEQVNSNVALPFPWLGQLGLGPLLQLQ